MISKLRPFLIVPKLINQPTWGGDYIVNTKKLNHLPYISQYSIGQSYELFSGTKLLLNITDSTDQNFSPEINEEVFNLKKDIDYIEISEIIDMPLLIKLTQAKGNSYQLHVKQDVVDSRWVPKAESWYYLEPGLLTCGIKQNINVNDYKILCQKIDQLMHDLSNKVINKEIDIETARIEANDFIKLNNPLDFVNLVESKKFDIFDMSSGGLHHSWQDAGNILYEIQQDRMDPVSTLRCFDQGKIKDDGTIREINIDDYFKYLDTSAETNDVSKIKKDKLITPYYAMDVIEVDQKIKLNKANSFVHFYVREGDVNVETDEGTVRMTAGYSCFVMQEASDVQITANSGNSVVLKTYIP
ncbi:MAG: hypothetical protein Q7R95_10990 [bacterium]|nr:hypothetical protein [bacterium]